MGRYYVCSWYIYFFAKIAKSKFEIVLQVYVWSLHSFSMWEKSSKHLNMTSFLKTYISTLGTFMSIENLPFLCLNTKKKDGSLVGW